MAEEAGSQSRADRSTALTRREYQTLAEFRFLLHRFLAFSQDEARAAGLTPRQHQALLAIKGFPGDGSVSVHDLAERLCIRPHSAVELVDRLDEAGLVLRQPDTKDRRRVWLVLSEAAEQRLAGLSAVHLEELRRLRPGLTAILAAIGEAPPRTGA